MEREGRSEAWAENPTVLSGTEGLFDQALFGEGKEAEIPLGLDNLGRGTGLGTRLSRDPEVGGSEQICPISWPQVDLRTRPLGCPGERHQGCPWPGPAPAQLQGPPSPWAMGLESALPTAAVFLSTPSHPEAPKKPFFHWVFRPHEEQDRKSVV